MTRMNLMLLYWAEVGIEVIATQRCEALCVLDVECIAHWWDAVERVEILGGTLTTVRIQGGLYQYHGIAQALHDVGILSGCEIVGCQHRGIGACQFAAMHVIAQLHNHFLIIVAGSIGLSGVNQLDMLLTNLFQVLDVIGG